jgi:hypothetical protein
MLPESLSAHLNADVSVAWPGQSAEVCKVFDFELFSETTRESLYDLLTDKDIDRIEDGELLPFAVLGLDADTDALEETSADGVLMLDGDRVRYAVAFEKSAVIGGVDVLVFTVRTAEAET